MDPFTLALAASLALVGYCFGSIKIVNQGTEGIVERFGQYRRSLKPGLNFVLPLIDTVLVESTREQLLDIDPQSAITRDNVTLEVDAVMFWKILDVQKAYYAIEDLEEALKNLVITTLRSEIGRMDLRETFSNRNTINQALLHELDEATETWGVKVIRVEVQNVKLSPELERALETERVAESRRKAQISEADGMVESIQRLSRAIQSQANSAEVLKFLIAQKYVDANFKLGESANSKIIFMDPKALTETVSELIATSDSGDISDSDANPNGQL